MLALGQCSESRLRPPSNQKSLRPPSMSARLPPGQCREKVRAASDARANWRLQDPPPSAHQRLSTEGEPARRRLLSEFPSHCLHRVCGSMRRSSARTIQLLACQMTQEAGVLTDWSAGAPPAPTPPIGAETEIPRPPPRRSAEADPPFLEPSPRAITLAQHRDAISPEAVESVGRPDQGPRVVIGRINVEVVPPPAEPKTSTASRPGPLTAASASVIGPLTGGIRSNLRLSLRHR